MAQKAFLAGFSRGVKATLSGIRKLEVPGFLAVDPVRL